MTLRDYILLGIKEAGSSQELAEMLSVTPQALSAAKAGKRGLPVASCFQLAKLTEHDPAIVIAASELATEKKPERIIFLLRFVQDKQMCQKKGEQK